MRTCWHDDVAREAETMYRKHVEIDRRETGAMEGGRGGGKSIHDVVHRLNEAEIT